MTDTPTPDPWAGINLAAYTTDGTQACIYGCTLKNQHHPHCPCHAQCPNHTDHCTGCAPRPAHDNSLLCGSCFHRRLRRPLRRILPLYDWLNTQRTPGLQATSYDRDLVTATHERSLPYKPEIVELLAVFDLLTNGWTARVAREMPLPGPSAPYGAPDGSQWLDQRAPWISDQTWVPTFIGHMRELNTRAGRLAPWQATRHHLPMPCLRCEQQTLVLFGGEDWVTCTAPDCDAVIGWSRYERLSRAIAGVHDQEAG